MSDFLDRIAKLPPKRLALLAAELNSRLEAVEKRPVEPVAIVGIGCRFPGGANAPEEFWQFLRSGVDAITEIPPERWDIDEYFDGNPDTPAKMATRWGSFLADVDMFDARFFGIAPREALGLDPHQRMLLEVAWEALEHAGLDPEGLMNSQTGVFVGPGTNDYYRLLVDQGLEAVDAYLVSGNAPSMSAGRLSYFYGFRGPSMTVDTACSSSLVAVHLACQALRAGDCRLALAGGANLILAPENMIGLSRAHMLSADGKCKAFDGAADGIVRGEGCAVVVLKRLADARADGNRVLAMVLGTAINQDGRSNGITAPNGPAQEAVIREALERSGVQPADVDYVEAHGTGTRLGDPIEMRALGAVFGEGRPAARPLKVGSVKTNLGHLEVTAGIAGLVKVALSLQHGEIPAHLHLSTPNPLIEWDRLPVTVPTARLAWPREAGRRRIAGVSSFGFSGTNAHVVLAEAPAEPPSETAGGGERPRHLLTLSARTPTALREAATRLSRDVEAHPDRSIADVCFTANTGRAHFAERAAVVASDHASLRQGLDALAAERADARVITGRAEGSEPPPVAFLFTGQGSQYVGMARELFETQPSFRRALESCDAVFRRLAGEPLLDTLYPADSLRDRALARIDQTGFTQPALFAVEYALAELWRSWGIVPSAVMGHSVGEYVAACVAGMMSMEDGLGLIIERARLMQALPAGGAMAAILADEERVRAACAPYSRTVSIAAINGPRNVVVSGAAGDVEAIRLALADTGIESKPLAVSHAFHSPLLEPMLDALERAASRVAYAEPKLDVVSNLTGQLLRAGEVTGAYWKRHAREPVRFADAVRSAAAQGCRVFVEVGPAPILAGMASECLAGGDTVVIPTLRRGRSDLEQMFAALGRVYANGARVDWKGVEQGASRSTVALPTYPFQRERFWPERRARRATAPAARQESWRDWLYEFRWETARPSELSSGRERNSRMEAGEDAPARNVWLVCGERRETVAELVASLRRRGAECTAIVNRAGDGGVDPDVTSIDFSSASEVQRFISGEARRLVGRRWVLIYAADASIGSFEQDIDPLPADAFRLCTSALHLAQSLAAVAANPPPRLVVITQGAQPVDSGQVDSLAQAPLWGFSRSLELEHPELQCIRVDLPACPGRDVTGLGDLAVNTVVRAWQTGESQIAVRNGSARVLRIASVPADSIPRHAFTIDTHGSVLITGGLSGLGLVVAEWLVQQGCRQLVLMGRRPPAPDASRSIEALEARGATVRVVSGDVGVAGDVERAIEAARAGGASLRGVMHAAGLIDDGVIMQQTPERFSRVMHAKVRGAWVLHRATSALDLDFFVLFSSAASILGSAGQSNYASANAFLDALAAMRRAQGRKALSINWGAWDKVGRAAARDEVMSRVQARGIPIEPAQGVDALGYLLGADLAGVAVLPILWSEYLRGVGGTGAVTLFEHVSSQPADATGAGIQAPSTPSLSAILSSHPPARRLTVLLDRLAHEASSVLGLRGAEQIDPTQPLNALGMDSLMAVELRNALCVFAGKPLPTTLLFNYPTLNELAEYFAAGAVTSEQSPASASVAGTSDATIDQLSEDALAALLAEKLNEV